MKHILSITLSVIIYVASGQNPMGERVMAELIDQHQNGTVTGWSDRLARIPVTGEWTGVGQAVVSGPDGREYQVEVVE